LQVHLFVSRDKARNGNSIVGFLTCKPVNL
jgi:hypothetical protein